MNKSNPGARQDFILDVLTANPNAIYIDVFATYTENFAVSRKTFDKDWNKARERHAERQQSINAAKEAAIIKEEVKAAKNGLKSKHERLMILQEQVDNTVSELTSPDFPLSVDDVVKLRRILKDLQAEISKIEGDYAPKKHEGLGGIIFTKVPDGY